MKKILLIQIILLMPLMAEVGKTKAIGKSQEESCLKARKKAYESYDIFQMNSGCTCKQIGNNEWNCEIYFNFSGKRSSKP